MINETTTKICHEKTAIAHAPLAPHPRQGTRALPCKVLRYRARADRVVRPYEVLPVNGVVGVGLPDDPPSLAPHPRQGTRALPYKNNLL